MKRCNKDVDKYIISQFKKSTDMGGIPVDALR